MLRSSCLTALMSSVVCALVATSAIGEAAFAQPLLPGQRRETYKISDINQSDADGFCRHRYGRFTSARLDRQNDVVICGSRRSAVQTQTGVGVGRDGSTVTTNMTINNPDWTENRHHLGEVCEYKHPNYGTWLGDGGHSCYDSYRTW